MIFSFLPRLERALRRLAAQPSVAWVEVWAEGIRMGRVNGPGALTEDTREVKFAEGLSLLLCGDTGAVDPGLLEDSGAWVADVMRAYRTPTEPAATPQEWNARWEDLVRSHGDAVVVTRQDGIVEFANQAAMERFTGPPVLGAPLGQLLPNRLREDGSVLPPDESPTIATFRTGKHQEQVIGYLQGDRSVSWYSIRTSFFDRERTRVLATLTDVTSIKRARDEAKAGEALLRSTFSALAEGILVLDERLAILDANPAAEEILGVPLSVLRHPEGKTSTRAVHPDGSPLLLTEWPAYRVVHRGESVKGMLLGVLRTDGQTRWLLMNAEPVLGSKRALVSFTDVTAMQLARAQAEAASARWRALMDSLHEAVILLDAEGRTEELNHAGAAIFGVGREALAAGPLVLGADMQVVDESGRPMAERPCERCRRTGEPVTGTVCGYVFPGKEVRWYVHSAVPLSGGRVLLSLLDFTAIRNASTEVERRKDEFISTLSHEMRTPLTSLDGALALIQVGAARDLSPEAFALVALARRSSARLIRLVNDVLDLERIVAGGISIHLGLCRVDSLVAQALDVAEPLARARRLSLRARAPEPITILTDGDRITQILGKFLANAVQHSPEGGAVTVSVQPRHEMVRISVRDHGPGVPVGFRHRLFTRFAQADGVSGRPGAGLGLSICRALARALGGEVGYEDVVEGGALFWLELPREVV